jgi:hypothetical protein
MSKKDMKVPLLADYSQRQMSVNSDGPPPAVFSSSPSGMVASPSSFIAPEYKDDVALKRVSPAPGGAVAMKKVYVPVKDRPLHQALRPQFSLPSLCPELRERLYRFYPGPTVMMHKMHWTEWIFVLFLLTSIPFFVVELSPSIQVPFPLISTGWQPLLGSLIIVEAFVALIMVWGLAKYTSLADVTTRLEMIAMSKHGEVLAYQEINDDWERGLQDSQDNLNNLAVALGLAIDDAHAMAKLTEVLGGLVSVKKKIQAEEKALSLVSVRHRTVTRAEIDEKARNNMKKSLGRAYDRIVKRGECHMVAPKKAHKKDATAENCATIDSPDEIALLRTKMEEDVFLNQKVLGKDGQPTNELKYNWHPMFIEIAADGIIYKWELLDALDEVTNSYFLVIRDALKHRDELEAQLKDLRSRKKKR